MTIQSKSNTSGCPMWLTLAKAPPRSLQENGGSCACVGPLIAWTRSVAVVPAATSALDTSLASYAPNAVAWGGRGARASAAWQHDQRLVAAQLNNHACATYRR